MENYLVKSIGKIKSENEVFEVHIDKEYREALQGLDGFGYIQIIWWFDKCTDEDRESLTEIKPYKKGPEILGAFATRTPNRPNPIALTTAYVLYIDYENGVIGLPYIDALDGSPVLDIKPYTPSLDRIENPIVPEWCSHWPVANEYSGDFDWEKEFNF